MPNESFAERILADARAAASDAGRLPLPDMADWDIFPFEGELRVKQLDEVVLPEPARDGELGSDDCQSCGRDDEEFL